MRGRQKSGRGVEGKERKRESKEGVFSLFIWKNDITQVRVGGEPTGFWDMVVVGLATGLEVAGHPMNS